MTASEQRITPESNGRLARRTLLRLSAATVASLGTAAILAACGGASATVAPTNAPASAATPVVTSGTAMPAPSPSVASPSPAPTAAAVASAALATLVPATGASTVMIAPATGELTLYASVPQDTLDTMIKAFNVQNPGVKVNLFRNGTGPVTAKIAAEQKAGKVQADLGWLAEPTGVQDWADGGLLVKWSPAGADKIAADFKGDTYWGTRIINVVIGYHKGASEPRPTDWMDLKNPAYKGKVGLPNPNYAGSTLGALGYFALTPQYGFPYYDALQKNGAVQLQGNQEIADGVAQGRFVTGMTLDYMLLPAIAKGAPVEMIWPAGGSIAVYSPITVFKDGKNPAAARQFVEFVISDAGQKLLVAQSFEPIRPDIAYTGKPAGAKANSPDWVTLLKNKDDLLNKYGVIFPS